MSHIQTHTQRYWDRMPNIDSPVKPSLSICLARQNKLIKHKRPSAGLPSAGQWHTSEHSISNEDSGSDTADHYTPSAETGSSRKQKDSYLSSPARVWRQVQSKKNDDECEKEKVKAPYVSDASSYQYASNNKTIFGSKRKGKKKMWSWWINARLSYLLIRRENEECVKKHYTETNKQKTISGSFQKSDTARSAPVDNEQRAVSSYQSSSWRCTWRRRRLLKPPGGRKGIESSSRCSPPERTPHRVLGRTDRYHWYSPTQTLSSDCWIFGATPTVAIWGVGTNSIFIS